MNTTTMNPDTINVVAEVNDAARAKAERRYLELLHSPDTTPAQLDQAITVLGKSPGEAAVDLRAIRRAAGLRELIQGGIGVGAQVSASIVELEEYQAETQRIIALRKQGYASLMQAQKNLTDKADTARRARDELTALQQLLPHLEIGD